jgi:hypothetical protein
VKRPGQLRRLFDDLRAKEVAATALAEAAVTCSLFPTPTDPLRGKNLQDAARAFLELKWKRK